MHHSSQRAYSEAETFEHLSALAFGLHLRRLCLQLDTHCQHVGAIENFSHRTDELLCVVDIVLGDIDDGQHRLVGEKEGRLEALADVVAEVRPIYRCSLGQHCVCRLERNYLVGE